MTLAVFFPSLMGFGILVSGALLVADFVHKTLPHRARRRRYRVAVGAHGVVASAAAAAGSALDPPSFLAREFRSRWAYLGSALALGGGAYVAARSGFAAHADSHGVFYESPWAFGLGLGFGIGFGLLAAGALVLAIGHRRLPRVAHRLVAATPVGRIRLPQRDAMTVGSRTRKNEHGGMT